MLNLIDLILKLDNDNEIKKSFCRKLTDNIDNNLSEILKAMASDILDEIEGVIEFDCGYGSNVRHDIQQDILKILKKYFKYKKREGDSD